LAARRSRKVRRWIEIRKELNEIADQPKAEIVAYFAGRLGKINQESTGRRSTAIFLSVQLSIAQQFFPAPALSHFGPSDAGCWLEVQH